MADEHNSSLKQGVLSPFVTDCRFCSLAVESQSSLTCCGTKNDRFLLAWSLPRITYCSPSDINHHWICRKTSLYSQSLSLLLLFHVISYSKTQESYKTRLSEGCCWDENVFSESCTWERSHQFESDLVKIKGRKTFLISICFESNCLAQHKAIQRRSLLLLSGLVPDLVLSMRQTEAVQCAVGLGTLKAVGSQRRQAPPDAEGSRWSCATDWLVKEWFLIPSWTSCRIMMNTCDWDHHRQYLWDHNL